MITEVSDIGSNALRVVISTKGKGDDPPIGPVFPGQVVHLHGPALKAPMNVTVSSPQTQNDDATITLHCMVDANTETLQAKWKEAGAEIKVRGPVTEPRLKGVKRAIAVFSETIRHGWQSLAPLVPLLKSYLAGRTEGLPETLFAYVVIRDVDSYRWLMAGFEDEYRGKPLPDGVRLAVHLQGGLRRAAIRLGTALEESFTWADAPWPDFKEVPEPDSKDHPYTLVVAGSAATWRVVLRATAARGADFCRLHTNSYGYYGPVQYTRRLPQPLPPPVNRWVPVDWLFRKTDPAPLGLFRICFGLVIFIAKLASVLTGEYASNYIDTEMRYPYDYWEWVPWVRGERWLYIHAFVLISSALFIACGCAYRFSCLVFLIMYTWQWMLDSSTYNNHYYLISMLAGCLLVTDANSFGCLRIGLLGPRFREQAPAVRPIPYWHVFLFKFLFSLVYFWGGIAKMNSDWVRGYPLWLWIQDDMHPDKKYALGLALSLGGLAFDLFVPLFLYLERTRPLALVGCHCFHVMNCLMFKIGSFPWLMHGTSLLFLNTHTPRHMLLGLLPRLAAFFTRPMWLSRWLLHLHTELPYYEDEHMYARLVAAAPPPKPEAAAGKALEAEARPVATEESALRQRKGKKPEAAAPEKAGQEAGAEAAKARPLAPATACPGKWRRAAVLLFLGVFATYQTLMPIRAYYFWAKPGGHNPSWSEHGHRFSWRMMLRGKICTGGFTVTTADASHFQYLDDFCHKTRNFPFRLSPKQCVKMWYHPHMIRHHAKLLANWYRYRWRVGVKVYADIKCSLNGGPQVPFTDPQMELGALPSRPSIWDWDWAEPFLLPQTWLD